MRISIVIPAHNEDKYIEQCLRSCLKQGTENFFEILVIDNASTDRTAEIARMYPKTRVIHEPRKGLTFARQRGLMEARGDLLAFVDADSIVPKNWLSIIHREFKNNPQMTCLSGPYDYYDLPDWQRTCVKFTYKYMGMPTYRVTRFMATGGNFVAPKKALQKISGFDTTISFHGEDTNIARRLHEIGKVKFLPEFFMYTSGRRFQAEGLLRTGTHYVVNFLSEVLLHHPVTYAYKDIR